MATLEVPNRYLALAPVIITSPTARCGTTLVQRLLSTSENAFVYGEEVGHQIRTVTTWLIGMLQQLERTEAATDADFQRAMAGTLTDWRPGLTAPTAVMQKAWIETYYQLPATLSDFSSSIGRPVWGFKAPSFNRDTLRALLSMMPKAKVIYLFRNPADVLSSAKARKFVQGEEQVRQFCAEWAKNMVEVSQLARDERILFMKYESLLAQRADHVRLLEAFTGAQNASETVFDLKINTYQGDQAQGYSPTQYIPPESLTDADRAALEAEAGPIMAHFYSDKA
jgi:hypothetical protein